MLLTNKIIFIDPFTLTQKKVEANILSCKWKSSVETICSFAEIIMQQTFERDAKKFFTASEVQTGVIVEIECGENYNNKLRFKGFVSSTVIENRKLKVNCEGYSYFLRNKQFVKTYYKPTIKQILKDLVKGTPIKLSKQMEYLEFANNFEFYDTGLQALEKLKNEYGLTVFFYNDELYVGVMGKYPAPRKSKEGVFLGSSSEKINATMLTEIMKPNEAIILNVSEQRKPNYKTFFVKTIEGSINPNLCAMQSLYVDEIGAN